MGAPNPTKYWKTYYFVSNHFFVLTTVRRRSWDQLRPKRAPKGVKITAKRDPRSRPKRAKIDIKINIDLGHATRVVQSEAGIVVWAGTPPREASQGPRGGGPSGTGQAPRHPCAR